MPYRGSGGWLVGRTLACPIHVKDRHCANLLDLVTQDGGVVNEFGPSVGGIYGPPVRLEVGGLELEIFPAGLMDWRKREKKQWVGGELENTTVASAHRLWQVMRGIVIGRLTAGTGWQQLRQQLIHAAYG